MRLRERNIRILYFTLFALFAVSIIISINLMGNRLNLNHDYIPEQFLGDTFPKTADYWNLTGSFIFIDDDNPALCWSKTVNENDWCTGNGTIDDPYIIKDVVMEGPYGIKIHNSDEYFIINNCTIHNLILYGGIAGIELYNVENGILSNNNIYDCQFGIGLSWNCINNTIISNEVNNNHEWGMYLHGNSFNNKIVENTATYNEAGGIELCDCNNNRIVGNTINDNIGFGIDVGPYCYNNTISGNDANNNFGGIRLSNSKDNIITENTANNNTNYGICLHSHNFNNTITRNSVNFNTIGIYFMTDCSYNTVAEILAHNKKALIIPRAMFRREQTIRTEKLSELGLISYLNADSINADLIYDKIRELLSDNNSDFNADKMRSKINLDGTRRLVTVMGKLIGSLLADREKS